MPIREEQGAPDRATPADDREPASQPGHPLRSDKSSVGGVDHQDQDDAVPQQMSSRLRKLMFKGRGKGKGKGMKKGDLQFARQVALR